MNAYSMHSIFISFFFWWQSLLSTLAVRGICYISSRHYMWHYCWHENKVSHLHQVLIFDTACTWNLQSAPCGTTLNHYAETTFLKYENTIVVCKYNQKHGFGISWCIKYGFNVFETIFKRAVNRGRKRAMTLCSHWQQPFRIMFGGGGGMGGGILVYHIYKVPAGKKEVTAIHRWLKMCWEVACTGKW